MGRQLELIFPSLSHSNLQIMKILVFWDVTPCNMVDSYQQSTGTCYLYLQGKNSEAKGGRFIQNVSNYLNKFLMKSLSHSPLREFKTLTFR
jgi:hypothetical protein